MCVSVLLGSSQTSIPPPLPPALLSPPHSPAVPRSRQHPLLLVGAWGAGCNGGARHPGGGARPCHRSRPQKRPGMRAAAWRQPACVGREGRGGVWDGCGSIVAPQQQLCMAGGERGKGKQHLMVGRRLDKEQRLGPDMLAIGIQRRKARTCMSSHMLVHTYTHMHMHKFTHTHTHANTRARTHTHTHTRT